jgi:hypothetical protein
VAHFFREVILLNTEMRDDSNLDGRDVFLAPLGRSRVASAAGLSWGLLAGCPVWATLWPG